VFPLAGGEIDAESLHVRSDELVIRQKSPLMGRNELHIFVSHDAEVARVRGAREKERTTFFVRKLQMTDAAFDREFMPALIGVEHSGFFVHIPLLEVSADAIEFGIFNGKDLCMFHAELHVERMEKRVVGVFARRTLTFDTLAIPRTLDRNALSGLRFDRRMP